MLNVLAFQARSAPLITTWGGTWQGLTASRGHSHFRFHFNRRRVPSFELDQSTLWPGKLLISW
jgi:hypothetical protein